MLRGVATVNEPNRFGRMLPKLWPIQMYALDVSIVLDSLPLVNILKSIRIQPLCCKCCFFVVGGWTVVIIFMVLFFGGSIKGHQEFIYNGDRTKEELLPYATRMSGPPVQLVTRTESVDMLKANHAIFFAFVGKQDGLLWDTYHSVAEHFQPHGFFYATSVDVANRHFSIDTLPAVVVYKERNHFYFPRKKFT